MSDSVEEVVEIVASLDPQLACLVAQAWGKLDSVVDVCGGSVMEGGEVKVWAVGVMKEVIAHASEAQLLQKCGKWKTVLLSALQTCASPAVLREVSGCVAQLVSRAHSTGLRDFSSTHLLPLLSSLLNFREAGACLQVAVLPAVSTTFLCYPMACKSHRSLVLQWAKEGLMTSDPSLSRECARLLVVTHQTPDHWHHLTFSSLSTLSSSLLHFSLTLSQTTPLPDDLNLDLPLSEPNRSTHLLRLITSHSRLLSYLLLSPPPSQISLSLSRLVGVVSFGLRISHEGVVATAMDSTLLLSLLPVLHTSLLVLLASLITSSHSHILPFSSAIDKALVCQMSDEGGVVWRECVSRAVCAWVRVRGEGGKGDRFIGTVVQWLLQRCRHGDKGMSLRGLCVVMEQSSFSLPPHLIQQVWELLLETLSQSPLPPTATLAGVRLLRCCLEYPGPTPLSSAVKLLQNLSRHSSTEVCEESRQGLAVCGLLLHPIGPPWGSHFDPIAKGPPANVDLMDVQPSTLPISSTSTPEARVTVENNILRPPQATHPDSRKRRREEELEEQLERETATSPAGVRDTGLDLESGRRLGQENTEDREGGPLGSGEGREKGGGCEMEGGLLGQGRKEGGLATTEGVGGSDEGRNKGGWVRQAKGDKLDKEGVVLMEEEGESGGDAEVKERDESDDSDVADIIATFCSSPSHSDSDSSS